MSVKLPIIGEPGAPQYNVDAMKVAKISVGIATTNDVVLTGAAETTALFAVEAGVFVHEVLARVTTAFTASAAITIGDTDVDGFFNATYLGCTTASADVARSSRIPLDSDTGVLAYARGRYYGSTDAINAITGGTCAAGAMDVYVVYSRQI